MVSSQYCEYYYIYPEGVTNVTGRGDIAKQTAINRAKSLGCKAYMRRVSIETYELDLEEEGK